MNISNLNNENLDNSFYDSKFINNPITIINQMVDTLKIQMYPSHDLSEKQMSDYNMFIEDAKELKQDAMLLKNDNKDMRYIKTEIDTVSFNVMASVGGTGFSVHLKNNDVDMMFAKISDKSNNPIIKIEFRSEYLSRNGYIKCLYEVQKVIRTILPLFSIKVSELHIATDVQGYNFTKLDLERVRCRNRIKKGYDDVIKSQFSQGSKFNSMSFGKDDFMMRIYNKTSQIASVPHAAYVEQTRWVPNGFYNPDLDVWRIEIQFRRKHLKTLIGKDGVLDGFAVVLNSIPDLWSYGMSRFVHHDLSRQQALDMIAKDTIHNGKLIPLSQSAINKRYQRAGLSSLWNTVSTFNNFKSENISKLNESKKPEVQYLVNCYKGVVSCATKLLRGNFDSEIIAEIITNANEEELNKKGLSILNSAKLKAVDYMSDREKEFNDYGVIKDGFKDYESDLQENLRKTFQLIESKNPDEANVFFEQCIKRGTMIYNRFDNQVLEQYPNDYEFYSY
jgi:hypothetical protein